MVDSRETVGNLGNGAAAATIAIQFLIISRPFTVKNNNVGL
jgi:hypothetical protein